MFTGLDPYQHMEVMINVGACKGHTAVVIGSRKMDGKLLVDVRTMTKLEPVFLTFEECDVSHLQYVNFLYVQRMLTPAVVRD
jgi:hypothetical protein